MCPYYDILLEIHLNNLNASSPIQCDSSVNKLDDFISFDSQSNHLYEFKPDCSITDELQQSTTKRKLVTFNDEKPKKIDEDLMDVEFVKITNEKQLEKNQMQRKKFKFIKDYKLKELELKREKFEFEKKIKLEKLKIKRKKIESREKLRLREMQKNEKIEMLKIEKQNEIEFAKLQINNK